MKFNTSADFYGSISRKSKCYYNYIQISSSLHEGQEHKMTAKNFPEQFKDELKFCVYHPGVFTKLNKISQFQSNTPFVFN